MCPKLLAVDDAIDVQPVIRSMTFDIVYGELIEALNVIQTLRDDMNDVALDFIVIFVAESAILHSTFLPQIKSFNLSHLFSIPIPVQLLVHC